MYFHCYIDNRIMSRYVSNCCSSKIAVWPEMKEIDIEKLLIVLL